MLIKTPRIRVKANPLTKLVPKANRIPLTIKVLRLLSLIDGHARLNPSSIAKPKIRPLRNSSFILSKIKMLASTAMPTLKIKPAIPASVKVTGISLKIAMT